MILRRLRAIFLRSCACGAVVPGQYPGFIYPPIKSNGSFIRGDTPVLWADGCRNDTEALHWFERLGRPVLHAFYGVVEPIFAPDGLFSILPPGIYRSIQDDHIKLKAIHKDEREYHRKLVLWPSELPAI